MLQRGSWTFPEFSEGERARMGPAVCDWLRPSSLCSVLEQSSGQDHKGVVTKGGCVVLSTYRELLLKGDKETVRKCSNHSLS